MKHSFQALLAALWLAFFLLPAAATTADPVARWLDTPARADTDERDYRNLLLANGMKVLLVSDPKADKAAAALDVAAGSGNDPRHRQGLAHFLEHMLFLGTAKYPQPGEYQSYISDHGGTHNAFTALEHTNFFFDIDPQYLEPALDRFAQFFIAPLFNEEYVNREKNAVDSEYQARITDDSRRLDDVFREIYHTSNPAATFSVGSLATLSDVPGSAIRDDLVAFYERHYSANTMALVVIGREPLDTLQKMVEQRFAVVPDRRLTIDQSARPVFRDKLLPAQLFVQSRQDERHLQLVFPLPSMQPYYRTKPDSYLSYLFGHEGKGSLFAALKEKGWALSLAAGSGLSNRFAATFDVDISLTEEGYRHIDDVAMMFFQTVAMLKDKGVVDWQYQEQKALTDLAFRFQEKQDAMGYASQLANNLQYYPPADVLRGGYLMEKFDKSLIDDVLSRLQPSNMLAVVMAPDIQSAQQSQYYQTPYRIEPVSGELLGQWQKAPLFSGIDMPAPNPFIPDNLKLKSLPLLSVIRGSHDVPQPMSCSNNCTLWYLQDNRFRVPKGSVMVYARSRHASASVREAAMSELFVRLLNDHLNPLLYTAQLSGLDFEISKRSRGIAFQLTGYSEKQGLLLKSVMDTFRNPVFTDERFRVIKQQWLDELANGGRQSPYKVLMQDVPAVLAYGYWTRQEYQRVLQDITLKDVQDYVLEFSSAIVADVLVYGNFYPAEAEKLAKVVESTLKLSASTQADVPARMVALPPVAQPFLFVDNVEHNDSGFIAYFQGAGDDVQEQVRQALLAQVLESPYFQTLRTEQQVGYVVSARYLPLARVPGVMLLVQSPMVPVVNIMQRTEQFLRNYYNEISSQDDAWFERQKQALLVQLDEKPKNLSEQSVEFWNDMTLDYTGFDHRQQQIAALKAMTRQQLLDAYRTTLLGENRRQLLLVSPGKAGLQDLPASVGNVVDNTDAFKARLKSYALQ